MKFALFVDDEDFGTGHREFRVSEHYLCPHCGKLWAHAIVEGAPHSCLSVPCEPCAKSIHEFYDPCLCSFGRIERIEWPVRALARDFLLLMELKDQFIDDNLPQ